MSEIWYWSLISDINSVEAFKVECRGSAYPCYCTPETVLERELHQAFIQKRKPLDGKKEWFTLSDHDVQAIERYFAAIARGEEF